MLLKLDEFKEKLSPIMAYLVYFFPGFEIWKSFWSSTLFIWYT